MPEVAGQRVDCTPKRDLTLVVDEVCVPNPQVPAKLGSGHPVLPSPVHDAAFVGFDHPNVKPGQQNVVLTGLASQSGPLLGRKQIFSHVARGSNHRRFRVNGVVADLWDNETLETSGSCWLHLDSCSWSIRILRGIPQSLGLCIFCFRSNI